MLRLVYTSNINFVARNVSSDFNSDVIAALNSSKFSATRCDFMPPKVRPHSKFWRQSCDKIAIEI